MIILCHYFINLLSNNLNQIFKNITIHNYKHGILYLIIILYLMYSQLPSPFYPRYIYVILDCLFIIFGILYMIGDPDHYNITVLRCAKPIPTWIMIIELFPIKNLHRYIKLIMIALFLGSIGDILL
jgi:hypothetical protein